MIITIDGPAASGKSTIAKLLAARLGMYYLYSGLLYRAVAFIAQKNYGTNLQLSGQEWEEIIQTITYSYHQGFPCIHYQGENITEHLNNVTLDRLVSYVSTLPEVRTPLLTIQRSIGETYDIIADGRDCGSVVFPHADLKFFLTANITIRAQRSLNDLQRHSSGLSLAQAQQALEARDAQDITRPIAPLIIPQGAIIIDSSHMKLEETLDLFIQKINEYQRTSIM